MKRVLSAFIRATSGIIGRKNLERLLVYSAKSINVNLHIHGLVQIGALNGFDQQINGEDFFIQRFLPGLCKSANKPVFFDIGANLGHYSLALRKYFPDSEIYAFEPVKNTFELLVKNTSDHSVRLYNIGFSENTGIGELFNTVNSTNSTIASAYKDVFHGLFKNDDKLVPIEFQMDTIDNFCHSNGITGIDFLKIDVEGHESAVLKGAINTLLNGLIKVIQFEFNTHNTYARVFLRDFYLLLKDFEFYRLKQDGMVRLGDYTPVNEIFTAQNIIAVHKSVSHGFDGTYLAG